MADLTSLLGCPCLACEDINRCFRGGHCDPAMCEALTGWISDSSGAEGWFRCFYCSKMLLSEMGLKIHIGRVHKDRVGRGY